MAPKKDDATVAPKVDTNPYGAFVNVAVDRGYLEIAPRETMTGKDSVKTVLILSYPGVYAPFKSEAMDPDASGFYNYEFMQPFRQGTSLEALAFLINSKVTLSVAEAVSGSILAQAHLDMSPLALGFSEFKHTNLDLTTLSDSSSTSPVKVLSGSLSSVTITLTARLPPDGMTPEEIAAASVTTADASEALPDPQPWKYISTEEADECNVVELSVSGAQPLPSGLTASSDTAREGKAPGRLSLSVALILPGAPPVVVSDSTVQPGGILLPGPRTRQYITKLQAKVLREHLEDGLPLDVEVARYLQHDSLSDPAWEHYHAAGSMASASDESGALMKMGSTAALFEDVALAPFTSKGLSSVLPPYTPSNPKGKPIEEVPAAGSTAALEGAWKLAGTSISLSVKLLRPLVPAWKVPEPSSAPISALIAVPMTGSKQYTAPTSALKAYRKLVSDMGAAVKRMAMDGAVSNAYEPDELTTPTARALTLELQSTSRYAEMRKALADAAVQVALERYGKAYDAGVGDKDVHPESPTAEQLSALHEELHAILTEELTAALSAPPAAAASASAASAASAELSRLLILALECEQAGLAGRAEALHQRRVLMLAGQPLAAAAAWHEYGSFCMRTDQRGRGEQCFREGMVLEQQILDGVERSCGVALAAALIYQAQVTDPLFLEEAEMLLSSLVPAAAAPAAGEAGTEFGHEQLSSYQGESEVVRLARILQVLAHQTAGRMESAADGLLVLEQIEGALNAPQASLNMGPMAINPCYTAAETLLKLGLPALSQSAAVLAEKLPLTGPILQNQIQLLRADALGQMGIKDSEEEAVQMLSSLASLSDTPGKVVAAAEEILGHIHYRAGRHTEAVHAYRAAQDTAKKLPPSGPLSFSLSSQLYLQLAQSYAALRHPDWALQVYTQACAMSPTASSWLGVAACRTALEEYDAASLALSEAALLDPENASVWGRISLVASKSGRTEESAAALKCAMRLGLEDGTLLADLGKELSSKGSARAAENLIKEAAVKRPEDQQIRELLAKLENQATAIVV